MRVLLIEDDSATAQSIELMLKSESFNVYTTDLGEEGVDLRLGHVEPEVGHPPVELLARHRAVAVVVPIAEQVDHAHRRLGERVAKLIGHALARVLVDVEVQRLALAPTR